MKADQKKEAKKGLTASKTDEELKQIAKDLWAGKIFSDRHIANIDTNPGMATSVFMPLVFLNKKQVKDLKDSKVNFMYEYLDNAGPMSVNGYPIFMTVRFLLAHETEKMFNYYEEFKKLTKDF